MNPGRRPKNHLPEADMNIVICDDELACIKKLADILHNLLDIKNVPCNLKTFTDSQNCLAYLSSNSCDLVFMDIFLPQLKGTDLALKLRHQGHSFKLIFLTSSNEFAQESFRAHASYYLLKPVTPKKVQEALEACQIFKKAKQLNITAEGTTLTLIDEQIIYIEMINRFCEIQTTAETLKSYAPFRAFTSRLSFPPFLLINRSLIINLNHVRRLEEDYFLMDNGHKAFIKSRGLKNIKNQYKQWLLENI